MDFFKSVFSDDTDPPKPRYVSGQSDNAAQTEDHDDLDRHPSPDDFQSNQSGDAERDSSISSGGWSFGGLIRNLTSKSESVIETYRRDLKEFGSGLRKELEVAQGSIGTVGHAFDEFGNSVLKGTAEMIAQGKDAILAVDHESDSDNSSSSQNLSGQRSLISERYNRFDAQVRHIQNDVSTYSLELEDLDDYNKWRSAFSLEEKTEEIEGFLDGNDTMLSLYGELVPNSIDSETFWSRYYYKVFKLKQAENVRAKLVKRAISKEEEELSWDVEDDDDEEEERQEEKQQAESSLAGGDTGRNSSIVEKGDISGGESKLEKSENLVDNKISDSKSGSAIENEKFVGHSKIGISIADDKVENIRDADGGNKGGVAESNGKKGSASERNAELSKNEAVTESNDNVSQERQSESGEPNSKGSNLSVVSSQPSMAEEEDLEWDEIEDLSSLDEKKPTKSGSPNKADLQKRLTAAEEEDLSWDIEDDDDEPSKS